MKGQLVGAGLLLLNALSASSATASDTVNYSYDANGRLVSALRTGTVNNIAVQTNYQYDKADNRTRASVVSGSAPGGSGGTPATYGVIVVPISGYSLIPVH